MNKWRKLPILQQPTWPNKEKLEQVILNLKKLPNLILTSEINLLKRKLTSISKKKAFVLQAGNCAEDFDECNTESIINYHKLLKQLSLILQVLTNKEIITIGRIAGQYSKPRSSEFEIIDGNKIPSYKGDNINDSKNDLLSRLPNPDRLLEGYFRSASTLNLLRSCNQNIHQIDSTFNVEEYFINCFNKKSLELDDFMVELNQIISKKKLKKKNDLYISHEALILDYEDAFTRKNKSDEKFYNFSAHTLWLGDRTKKIEHAHVEYLSHIENPIGIKVGPDSSIEELLEIVNKINPKNLDNRIMIISRMGVNNLSKLEELIQTFVNSKHKIIWLCDPMHGNTIKSSKFKTRKFDDILNEVKYFINICYENNVIPGGIHIEITHEEVTECLGGLYDINLQNLALNYKTKVDPRLNAGQAIELCYKIGKLINYE